MMQVVGFDMARAAANKVYEAAGIGPEDLDVVELHDCFAHNELITYEALGLCPEGGARTLHRRWRQYLWRQVRHQSLRRPAVEGPSARRHRPGAMLRADASIARHRRRNPGRWRATGIAAQSRPRRRLRRHALRTRLRPDMVDQSAVGRSFTPVTAHVEPGRLRFFLDTLGERNPVYTRCRGRARRRLCRDAGAADLPVLPGNDGRRTAVRIPDRAWRSISPACCMANSVSPITRPWWSATP